MLGWLVERNPQNEGVANTSCAAPPQYLSVCPCYGLCPASKKAMLALTALLRLLGTPT